MEKQPRRRASGPSAEDLRQRRAALGLTQAALAGRLGVSVTTVIRWETAVQTAPLMLELALAALEAERCCNETAS